MDAVTIRSKIQLLEQQITTLEAITKTAKSEIYNLRALISVCSYDETSAEHIGRDDWRRRVKYQTDELLQMARAGWTAIDIAEFYGTSPGSIRVVLKKRGISLREEWRKAGMKPHRRRKAK